MLQVIVRLQSVFLVDADRTRSSDEQHSQHPSADAGIWIIQGDTHHHERFWKQKLVCCKLHKQENFISFDRYDQ